MSDKLREEMGLEQRWRRPRDVKPGLEAKYPRKFCYLAVPGCPLARRIRKTTEAAAGDAGEEEEDGKESEEKLQSFSPASCF